MEEDRKSLYVNFFILYAYNKIDRSACAQPGEDVYVKTNFLHKMKHPKYSIALLSQLK